MPRAMVRLKRGGGIRGRTSLQATVRVTVLRHQHTEELYYMVRMLVHSLSFEVNESLELIVESLWSSSSMPGPWLLRTALLLSIALVAVGFSFPANFGSVAGYNGVHFSSFRAKSGGIRGVKAERLDFSETTRLAGARRRPWPRRHRAVAIEGIDTKNAGESSSLKSWGDQSNKDDDISYAKMLKFILPTLGIWLASPIMGLIDAGVIGTRSALELAALGPATVLCESLIYFSTFLAVATTNLQATALANRDRSGAQKVVAEALGLALAIGLIVAAVVQLWGPQMLARLAGEKSTEVIPAALLYSRVRILGAPASIAAMVLQAACLGARDSATPLGVVLVASAINGVGDWWAVCRMGMGIFGAAAATASAEMASMVLLGVAVWKAQGERLHRFVTFPSREELKVLLDFAGPIAFALFGKIICYSAMTLAVTSLGTIPLATHNVMMRFFFFFGTFGEALSQTAQAFIPGQLARERNMKAAQATAVLDGEGDSASTDLEVRRQAAGLSPARTMMRKVLTLGVVVGSVNACVAGLIPLRFPHLFTNSVDVAAGMRSLVPLMSWSLLSHAVVLALEGIILARRSLRFLADCYAINTVVIVVFLQWVKTWPAARGLHGIWFGLLLLQLLRVGELGMHLLMLDRRKAVGEVGAAE